MTAEQAETGGAHEDGETQEAIEAAFGERNRQRLIAEYFKATKSPQGASSAWADIYRMLLWTDRTTGLAHCYESDKCQPGKPWYARSLAFHSWLSDALGVAPTELARELDWLFLRAAAELAAFVRQRSRALSETARKQRQPYESKAFPSPGEEPEVPV